MISKPSSFQFDDRRLKSKCQISEEDQLLREMMSRYDKLEQGRAERESSTKFTDPALNSLVTRVRRESKIFRLIQNKYKNLKRHDKGKILSRCNYAVESSESERKPPSYSYIILGEEKKIFSRLKKPSEEDVLLARKINKINLENLASTSSAKTECSLKMELEPDITKSNCETEQRDSLSDSGIDDTGTSNTSMDSSQTKMEKEEAPAKCLYLVDNHKHDSGDKFVNDLDSVSCHRPLSTNILQEHIQEVDSKVLNQRTNETSKEETSLVISSNSIPEGKETICHLDNDQFDVEVSFCDNIEVLEENNQTYLVLETDENGLEEVRSQEGNGEGLLNINSQANVSLPINQSSEIEESLLKEEKSFHSNEQSESAEEIEDIQKFLLASETLEDQKSTGDKSKKSSKASEGLYTKESALKIISQSSYFIKNNVRTELRTSKVQTFEDALNAATAPSKRQAKSIQVKSSKDNRGDFKKSKSVSGSAVKSNQTLLKKSSPDSSPKKFQPVQKKNVDVVSKIMAEQSKSFIVEPKKPVLKPDLGSSKSKSKSVNITSAVKTCKKETPRDSSSFPLKEPTYEEIYRSLKNTILKDTTIKPFDQIIPSSLPRAETKSRPPLTTEPLSTRSIESPRPRAILPKPVPSHVDLGGTRGMSRDPVKTEARPRVPASHSPHVSPVKRGEASQGYYTSPVKVRLII